MHPIVISNFSVASRMGQAASGSNFSVAATEKLPVRALSYKAVFSIRAIICEQLKLPVRA